VPIEVNSVTQATDLEQVASTESAELKWAMRLENLRRSWYKFSRNRLSIAGLAIISLITLLAIFAPWVTPHPEHAGPFFDIANSGRSPNWQNLFGTDLAGRDILSRVVFGFRTAILMGLVVLGIAVPPGVTLGLIAGYNQGTWLETLIMRVTDVFLSVPPLLLALAIASVLKPNLLNGMLAVTVMWWPWYTRLVYGLASTLRNEFFVASAKAVGASDAHIMFGEILPNCVSPIFTKMSLDMGWVILIGSSLSFVGLGEQPPRPGLGTMMAEGARQLPELWWLAVFPALAIVSIVLGFNLLGDGLRDMLAAEEV
jgi:peptide/nickel transport system permease protein